jgi:type I restriction enzyme M protein
MRGSVDGWDFKSYILGILFYLYISENITNYINRGEWESGKTDFDYADPSAASRADILCCSNTRLRGGFPLPNSTASNGFLPTGS